MEDINISKEVVTEEKLITDILPKTLFCEECGITETSPSFGQRYCRYCGTIFKNKSWFYGKGDEDE